MQKMIELAKNLRNLCVLLQSMGEETKKELDKITSSNDILTEKAMLTASVAEDIKVDDRSGIEMLAESIEEARKAIGRIGPVTWMEGNECTEIGAANTLLEIVLASVCDRRDKDSSE